MYFYICLNYFNIILTILFTSILFLKIVSEVQFRQLDKLMNCTTFQKHLGNYKYLVDLIDNAAKDGVSCKLKLEVG